MEYRVNKYLAMCGVSTRRGADKLIEEGVVTINGKVAVAGDKVADGDVVMVNGKEAKVKDKYYCAFYKPVGVTCTNNDPHADVIIDMVFKHEPKLNYAGRLDRDSEGLLIMTNDGDLIDAMMRSRNNHEKEYVVTLKEDVNDSILNKLREGVYLPELDVTTKKCKVKRLGDKSFDIILTQGLNRQIRRMCAEFDLNVKSLKRVRVCNIMLGDLKSGESRYLTEDELRDLYRITGVNANGNN